MRSDNVCFKHHLTEHKFFTVDLYKKQIFLSFRIYMQFSEGGKYYPTKHGVTLNLTEFNSISEICPTVLSIINNADGYGLLFSKEIGKKLLTVTREYNMDENANTISILIQNLGKEKQYQQICLTMEDFEKFNEVLPDIDGEISVALIFSENNE